MLIRILPFMISALKTINCVPLSRVCPLLISVTIVLGQGCARHHTYIDPNGNVTTVGHQPFWGPSHVQNQSVITADVSTQVQGGKIVSSGQTQGQAIVGGVVNPAIPEAIIVQNPGNPSASGEPILSNTGAANADAPATQISGGISKNSDPIRQ